MRYIRATIRKFRVLYKLYGLLAEAIGMNQWKRASNICDRINRVKYTI